MELLQTQSEISMDDKLIELVKANPILYEKEVRNTPYDSVKKRTELWKSISVSLGIETRYCIMRWKILRDKFRREVAKSEHCAGRTLNSTVWPQLEKLRFLENQIKYYGLHQTKVQAQAPKVTTTWHDMDADQLIEEVEALEDEALQEAMDESALVAEKVTEVAVSTSNQQDGDFHPTLSSSMRRMEVLLEGLDMSNRHKAEKRIVAYLCKCQLKTLNNEDVDDVLI